MHILPFVVVLVLLAGCTMQQPPNDSVIPPEAGIPPVQQQQMDKAQQTAEEEKPGQQPVNQQETLLTNVSLFEDFVVSDKTHIINRTRFFLHGNLIVNGTGRLVVADSEIVFVQDFNQQHRAYVMDNAVLEMDNVRLDTQWKWFNFDYRGNATVRMNKVRGNDCCLPWHGASEDVRFYISNSTIGLTINNNVNVTVRDSSSMFFELVLADVKGSFKLPEGDVDEFRLAIDNNRRDRMVIDVKNSGFHHWGTTLDKNTDVAFVDTKITIGMNAGSNWRLPAPKVKVAGLKAKRYDNFSLQFDTNYLHLVNTEVTSWYPQGWNGATIELADSDLADLQNNGKDSRLIVRNSTVDIAIARENVVQKYYDSEIRQDVIVHDYAEIHLFNTRVGGRMIENGEGRIFIDGSPYG